VVIVNVLVLQWNTININQAKWLEETNKAVEVDKPAATPRKKVEAPVQDPKEFFLLV